MRKYRACRIRRDHAWVKCEVSTARKRRFVCSPIRHPAIEGVVEQPEAAAQTCLSITKNIPGKTKAWRKVLAVREIPSFWRTRIAREHQPKGSVDEPCGLQTRNDAEAESSGVRLRSRVLVAQAKSKR